MVVVSFTHEGTSCCLRCSLCHGVDRSCCAGCCVALCGLGYTSVYCSCRGAIILGVTIAIVMSGVLVVFRLNRATCVFF